MAKLGIKKEEIVDANGSFKSMSDIMGVLQEHTQSLSKTEKGTVFNSLFGTTGQQAGMILAENSARLGELTEKTQEASDKGRYVQELAEKNSQTAQANMQRFQQAWEALTIEFGAELLPYMTEAANDMTKLFSEESFQKKVREAAKGVGNVAKNILKVGEFAGRHYQIIANFAKAIAAIFVVDKVANFVLKMKRLGEVFGVFGAKLKKEQAEVATLTTEYLNLAQAKQVASESYTGGVSTKANATEELAQATTTYYPSSTGKAPEYKNVGTTVAKEVEEGIATSGAIEAGVAKSASAATKGASLASKALSIGTTIMGYAGAAIAVFDIGKDIATAVKSGTQKSKIKATTSAAGALIGGLIGASVGGPMGAAIGVSVGQAVGSSSFVQKLAKKWKSAMDKSTKDLAKQGFAISADGTLVKINVKKDSLTKAQKSIAKQVQNATNKMDVGVIKMSAKTDKKSLDKSRKEIEKYYASIVRITKNQSKKRADEEKKAAKEMLKQNRISQKQYEQYIKSIDKADQSRNKKAEKNYKALSKLTENYQKQLTKTTEKEERKRLTDKYNKERIKLANNLAKQLARTLSNSSKEQTKILEKLKSDKGKISNQEAKELINTSAKESNKIINHAEQTYKETVKQAKNTYKDKVAQYKRMHEDIPGYTKDMMEQDIKNAQQERDNTIDAASRTKKETIKSAKDKHDQIISYASKENSSVSKNVVAEGNNGIQAYNSWGSAAHKALSFLSNAWSTIVKAFGGGFSANIPTFTGQSTISSRATGGVAKSGPTLVGEAGPELVYTPWSKTARIVGQRGAEVTNLRQGEQVLNASDTAKVMSGTFAGTLPGYANGTGFSLSGLISGLKDKVLDVADDILDTLKKPAEWINKGFSQWTSVQAFDFTKSSLMDYTRDLAKKSLIKPVTNAFKKLAKAYEDSQGTMANVSGGASAWTDIIKKVARKMEVNLTSGGLSAILRRINQESRGSATVANNWDSNAKAGHPSKGLLQYIQPTLNTWAAYSKGFGNNILNGSDQIAAMFNDSNWLRDISVSGGWGPTGHKRFANGGLVTAHQIIEVAENNMPEMVIPLDLSKRSRAYQLMGQVMDRFQADDGVPVTNDIETKAIEEKLDQVIGLFSQMLGLTGQQIKAIKDSAFSKQRLYTEQAADRRISDFQAF